jgi:hypothetical protein
MTEQWEQPPNPVSLPVPWSIGSWKVWQQLIKKGTHDRARTRRRLCQLRNAHLVSSVTAAARAVIGIP